MQRNHFLFGMVSSIIPNTFKHFTYQPPFHQTSHFQQAQINEQQARIDPRTIMVSRNFAAGIDNNKTMLQQTIDPRFMGRNTNAPIRTTLSTSNEQYPIGYLLELIMILIFLSKIINNNIYFRRHLQSNEGSSEHSSLK